jgi:hypothetical protein
VLEREELPNTHLSGTIEVELPPTQMNPDSLRREKERESQRQKEKE